MTGDGVTALFRLTLTMAVVVRAKSFGILWLSLTDQAEKGGTGQGGTERELRR